MCIHIYIYIYRERERERDSGAQVAADRVAPAQRPQGCRSCLAADKWVNTNGTAAKLMCFYRLGKKVRLGSLRKTKLG